MSLVQVTLSPAPELRMGGADTAPFSRTLHAATPKSVTSSTTAVKPAIIANAAAVTAGKVGDARRLYFTITNAGSDVIYVIFGKALTAANYNTGNAPDSGHLIPPYRSRPFQVEELDTEVVIIQAS